MDLSDARRLERRDIVEVQPHSGLNAYSVAVNPLKDPLGAAGLSIRTDLERFLASAVEREGLGRRKAVAPGEYELLNIISPLGSEEIGPQDKCTGSDRRCECGIHGHGGRCGE